MLGWRRAFDDGRIPADVLDVLGITETVYYRLGIGWRERKSCTINYKMPLVRI